MKTTYIYELIDPKSNKPRYIGKSNNPQKRLESHLKEKKNTYKNNWIKKLKKENLIPVLNIIDEVSIDTWVFWVYKRRF